MLNLNGFRAWITVDHKPLDAYNVEINTSKNIATCFVPSTVGKRFAVTWQDHNRVRPLATSGRVTVDGLACGGKVIPPSGQGKTNKARRDGVRTSPTAIRPFIFGKLELTDDDKYLDSKSAVNLGEITLTIHPVDIEGTGRTKSRTLPKDLEDMVHERSKKATSHRVKLGDEIKCSRRWTTVVKDIEDGPTATFVFKYRPIDVLRANSIIPTPSPTPAPKRRPRKLKRTHDELTSDDEVEILVLDKILSRAHNSKIKKRKAEPKPKHKGPFTPGEVIDLT